MNETKRREHVHPTPEMVAWFELAATYERARLGEDISEQTERALQQMVTFLTQPAQAYNHGGSAVSHDRSDEIRMALEEVRRFARALSEVTESNLTSSTD